MSSVSGVFDAVEVINPAINQEDVPSAFPFIQSDLYNEVQPGSFNILWFQYGNMDEESRNQLTEIAIKELELNHLII